MPADELAAFGLVAEEPVRADDDATFYLWPDNARAWQFWLSVQTQWAWAARGMEAPMRVGLPASEIESELRLQCVPRRLHRELHQLVRVMEGAALDEWRQQRERDALRRPR